MNEWLKSEIDRLTDNTLIEIDSVNNFSNYDRCYQKNKELKHRLDFLLRVLESFQIDIQKGVESDGKLYYDVNQKRDATFEYGDIQYPYWEKEDG